ncbi:hypothetical protein ACFRCG_02995 [Embleya sp. NPDC056575]
MPGRGRRRPDCHDRGYYEACIERIGGLADGFFREFSNHVEGHIWADL